MVDLPPLSEAEEDLARTLDAFTIQTGLQFSVMRLPGNLLLLCAGTMAMIH
jgi:hypothetical protein